MSHVRRLLGLLEIVPCTDPLLIDEIVQEFSKSKLDFLSNCADGNQLSVPDGFLT